MVHDRMEAINDYTLRGELFVRIIPSIGHDERSRQRLLVLSGDSIRLTGSDR